MKKFLSQNWYKLMIGTSMLMASFGFMIHTITPVNAQTKGVTTKSTTLGTDGSTVTVKLTDEQLKLLMPPKIHDVNIQEIYGGEAAAYRAYKDNSGNLHYALGVDRDPW